MLYLYSLQSRVSKILIQYDLILWKRKEFIRLETVKQKVKQT